MVWFFRKEGKVKEIKNFLHSYIYINWRALTVIHKFFYIWSIARCSSISWLKQRIHATIFLIKWNQGLARRRLSVFSLFPLYVLFYPEQELNKIFAKKGSIPETQLIIPHSSSIHANQSESIELLKSDPNMEGAVILFWLKCQQKRTTVGFLILPAVVWSL